jgi:hypothetical protein
VIWESSDQGEGASIEEEKEFLLSSQEERALQGEVLEFAFKKEAPVSLKAGAPLPRILACGKGRVLLEDSPSLERLKKIHGVRTLPGAISLPQALFIRYMKPQSLQCLLPLSSPALEPVPESK